MGARQKYHQRYKRHHVFARCDLYQSADSDVLMARGRLTDTEYFKPICRHIIIGLLLRCSYLGIRKRYGIRKSVQRRHALHTFVNGNVFMEERRYAEGGYFVRLFGYFAA